MSTVNFNDTTPVPATNFGNVKWQSDASGNIAAEFPLSQAITTVSADYTVQPTDQIISILTGCNNLYLPANPIPGQMVTARCFVANGTSMTVNGNGRLITGATTSTLYAGQYVIYYLIASNNQWGVLFINNSSWQPWTPTVTASASMTVSGLTIIEAVWQYVNVYTVNYKLSLSCTLGGTTSTTVIASSPITAVAVAGAPFYSPVWVQAPAEPFPQDTWLNLISPANGLNMRRMDGANLTLGAYTIHTVGFYRVG